MKDRSRKLPGPAEIDDTLTALTILMARTLHDDAVSDQAVEWAERKLEYFLVGKLQRIAAAVAAQQLKAIENDGRLGEDDGIP